MLTFNPSLFFRYATCPHWIWRDLYGDQSKKGDMPELAAKLLEQGVLHEDDYIKGLAITSVATQLGEAGYIETDRLMRAGTALIYQGSIRAVLKGVCYQGRPDLLEKLPGKSKFGDYYYRPVDIKNSKRVKPTHWLQLTLYALILKQIQGVFPQDCEIINSEYQRVPIELSEMHRVKTWKKIKEILAILEGKKPPLKLVSTCKQNPWFKECIREAEAVDDIALIYKLDSRALTAFRTLGIKTVHDAAKIDLASLPIIPFTSADSLKRIKLQAQALINHDIYWLQKPIIPEAPLKIYFDIEGDPLLQVQYLFGFWIVDGKKPGRYVYFIAEQPEDEAHLWQEFIDWIRTLPINGYKVYHFADYERSRVLGMAKTYGGEDIVAPFVENFIDLCKTVQESVIFPLYFYSIKDIAKSKFLNYKWRHPKAGGAQSIFWYEKWLETKDKQVLQDIIDYNEDDVIATEYLHRWLSNATGLKRF
jgi:uncharacterized protein